MLKIWQADSPFNLYSQKTKKEELKEINFIIKEKTEFFGNMNNTKISFKKDFLLKKNEENLSFLFYIDKNNNIKIKNSIKKKNLLKNFWLKKKDKEQE